MGDGVMKVYVLSTQCIGTLLAGLLACCFGIIFQRNGVITK